MSSIHTRIRERREALGMSQKDLAQAVDVEYQTVQHWEREPGPGIKSSAPKRTRMAAVAAALKVSEEWLATGRDADGNLVDPIKKQLDSFYEGMSPEKRHELVAIANALYNLGREGGSAADPFNGKKPPNG